MHLAISNRVRQFLSAETSEPYSQHQNSNFGVGNKAQKFCVEYCYHRVIPENHSTWILICYQIFFFLKKYTNIAPEKSSENVIAYLCPFMTAGSIGPAKSVCINSKVDAARLSDCLFLLWENFPWIQISQFLFRVPIFFFNFHSFTYIWQFSNAIVVAITKYPMPSTYIMAALETIFRFVRWRH